VHKCTNFSGVDPTTGKPCAGYEPHQSRYGRGWGGLTGPPTDPGHYSGILECPCNSRYGGDPVFYPHDRTKVLENKIMAIPDGTCSKGQAFTSAQTCYAAIAGLGFEATKISNKTESDPKMPAGCVLVKNADGSADALYNTGGAGACAKSGTKVGGSNSEVTKVTLGLSLSTGGPASMHRSKKGEYCQGNKQGVLKKFLAKTESAADLNAALKACETFCEATTACNACSVDNLGGKSLKAQWVAIPACGKIATWSGAIPGDISTKSFSGNVTITLKGTSFAWFGVGFNAVTMANQPYTLIVNDTAVVERKLGTCGSEAEHCPGTVLAPSVHLVSNTVENGVRTVVLTRPLVGMTKDHYTFGGDSTFNYISAVGGSQFFAQHRAHDSLTMSLMAPTGPTCVCTTGITGQLCETNATSCRKFSKNCAAHSPTLGNNHEASGDLLAQRNPTCNSVQYAGGLSCCHHNRIMLDKEQTRWDADTDPVTGKSNLLRYHMKFRFWYQEYKPAVAASGATPATNASHEDLPRIYFQTEANAGEYDIPPAFYLEGQPKVVGYPDVKPWPELTPGSSCTGKCPHGDDCECVHTITYNHTVSNMRLIYAGGHCHAPSCIGIWLYRNDPGHEMELLCHQAPIYGNGTGVNSVAGMYDEAGYLALPPCLWGPDEGLEPSVLLPPNTELVSIKRNRNTHQGHFVSAVSPMDLLPWPRAAVGLL
jgi:hypothetical protein